MNLGNRRLQTWGHNLWPQVYPDGGEGGTNSKELARKLAEMERQIASHDENIQTLFQAIRELMKEPVTPRKQIGFHLKERHSPYMAKVKKGHPN